MAAPIIPDNGKTGLMGALLFAIANGANTSRVHLFSNNYTPDASTLIGDFTEVTAGGLAAQVLPPATDAGVVPGGIDNWDFGVITWIPTGSGLPEVAFGYWIDFIDPSTGSPALCWCQRFDAPWAFVSPLDVLQFSLNLAGTQG